METELLWNKELLWDKELLWNKALLWNKELLWDVFGMLDSKLEPEEESMDITVGVNVNDIWEWFDVHEGATFEDFVMVNNSLMIVWTSLLHNFRSIPWNFHNPDTIETVLRCPDYGGVLIMEVS